MMMARFVYSETLESVAKNIDNVRNGIFVWCDETKRLYVKMEDKLIGITPGKRAIKKIECASCGNPINIDGISSIASCPVCGSVYDIDSYNSNDFSNKTKE